MTSTDVMVPAPLAPILTDPDAVSGVPELTRLHEQVSTIADLVGGAQKQVRERLDDAALADAGGAGVTRRVDGVRVIVTDPQPTPQVSDPEVFAGWWASRWPDEVEYVERVEVVDQVKAREALTAGDEVGLDAIGTLLLDALDLRLERVLPAKALDLAISRASLRCVEVGDGWLLIDPATGEEVPGTAVRPAGRQQVQVRPDRKAREAAVAGLRAALAGREVGGGA